MRTRIKRIIWLLAWFGLLFVFKPALATPLHVAVLHKPVSGAHARVYQAIVSGMESQDVNVSVLDFAFSPDTNSQALILRLQQMRVDIVIGLGKLPEEILLALRQYWPILESARQLTSRVPAGISLDIAPELLFAQLKQLLPDTKRVFVVYDPVKSDWLISLAQTAAKKHTITLMPIAVHSVREALQAYEEVFQQADMGDGIWLLLDSAIPPRDIMSDLLQQAWQRHLSVFSSNPLDVKRGVLFALFPDYFALGQQLAEQARLVAIQPASARLMPLQTEKRALNTRTALHLGISPTSAELRDFDLLYPKR